MRNFPVRTGRGHFTIEQGCCNGCDHLTAKRKPTMKSRSMYVCFAAFCFAAVTWAAPEESQSLSRIVAKLGSLPRVTETPHRMADSTAALCKIVYNTNIHEGAGDPAYCHVHVTENAKTTLLSGEGSYPVGSVIVKAKLENEKSREATLYTVMRKREAGYDAEHGDWEYAVLDGRTKRIQSRGRIDSCIDCHQQYESTDFVTRAYLKSR